MYMSSSISQSNLLKPPKTWKDIGLKSKTLSKIIARGSALSLSVCTIASTLKIASVAVVADAFLPIPIACVVFSLLYEIIPDSYSVIKKKLLLKKKGEVTEFEKSELNEIQMIINQEIETINTSRTVSSNQVMNQINNEPILNEELEPIQTDRTIYQDSVGNKFVKY